MKNEPILSIIIPSYNTSAYIDECLPFFINEKLFGKVVIYLIDDGATDDTAEKISRYTKLYPNYFKFVHKENGGHGSVINYAVYNLIQTKYFKVIDGDDWVDTDNLIEFVDFLENNDSDLIVSDYDKVYQNKIEQVKCYVPNSDYFNSLLTTIHSLTYKTAIYKNNKILLTEKCFYEDNQFVLYPLRYVSSVNYFSKTVYKYRLGNIEQSVSLSSMLKRFGDYEIIRNEIFSKYLLWKKEEKNTDFLRYAKYSLTCFFEWSFEAYLLLGKKRNDFINLYSNLYQCKEIAKSLKKIKIFWFISLFGFRMLHFKRKILKQFVK